MERDLNYYAKGAAISKIDVHDTFDQNNFATTIDFESAGYGQMMQGRMLVFNAAVIEPAARHFPAATERNQPIVLNAHLYRKQVYIKLPDGFTVDELPSPFQAESPFAKFTVAYRQEPGQMVMEEEIRTEAVTLPPSDYQKVKKFFDNVYGADNQQAVLVKK